MKIQIDTEMLEDTSLSLGAKVLYARLALYQGTNGRAWPRQETLAQALGTSERSIQRWVAELREAGLLEVRRVDAGLNTYSVRPSHPDAKMAGAAAKMAPSKGPKWREGDAKMAGPYIQEKNQGKESLKTRRGGCPPPDTVPGGSGHTRERADPPPGKVNLVKPKPDQQQWEEFCGWYNGPVDAQAKVEFSHLSPDSREALLENGPGWMDSKRFSDGFYQASEFLRNEAWRRPPHKPKAKTGMEKLLEGAR